MPPARYTELGYLPCRHLPGAGDAVVIMKTGVTELEDRLPPHLQNTLKCPPNSVIFSDHEELYQGKYEIRDVLANISPEILQHNDDFSLYPPREGGWKTGFTTSGSDRNQNDKQDNSRRQVGCRWLGTGQMEVYTHDD